MQDPQDMTQTRPAPEESPAPAAPSVAATPPGPTQDAEPDLATSPQPGGRPRGRTLGLAALAGAAAVGVLAVGFALGSGASDTAGPASPVAPAAERQGRADRIIDAGWTSPDGRTQLRLDGPGMRGIAGGRGYGSITITAIDGTKLSLETGNGWTRTIDASGATVTEGGETVALSTLEVGDRIAFRETRNDDGSFAITAISVVQPTVAGTVASVSGTTVTVTDRDGTTQKVTLTDATTYMVGRSTAAKDSVVAGVRIVARGSLGTDGTLTASSVVVEPAVAMGTVKEKAASSITLTTRDGSTVVVKVTGATTYAVEGVDSATLADVEVGAVVAASGTSNADGSLTATVVRARAAGTFGGPGMGGGRGPGMDDGWGRGRGGRGPGGFPGWGPGDDISPDGSQLPSGDGASS